MKRSWEPRGPSPPPSMSKMSSKGESGRSRGESSTSRSQISSYRRSRSPRRKKSPSPLPKRGNVLRDKRPPSRSRRTESLRNMPKRSRISARSRSPSRRMSKDKVPPYSCTSTKESAPERVGSRSGHRDDRYRSGDKYLVDRPSFRGPDKDIMLDRDSLKKIVVNMRDTPTENDTIKRDIVNPEDITVVRRAGEGSRPIFDRDEIKNSNRKFEEDEQDARRLFSDSPPHPGRRPCSSERFSFREPFFEDDRRPRNRDAPGPRPKDYGSHDRHRDERSRYGRRSRSRERSRDFGHERRERYDDREHRRTRARPRPSARPFRRHPSPVDTRRTNGRRLRSAEREHEPRHREKDLPPDGEYSAPDYPVEGHGYYEGEGVEGKMPPSSRGGSHSLAFRGRGGSGVPMVRAGDVLIRGGPPVRPVRAVFIPRVPGMGRRLPFPPRLIRPIVRPVIRVLAPVIPVRSPPVIPVRHPVIPLPFQCEAFK